MNDGDYLLRAILDDPDDDLVRLAYADWLDENGQGERAEFIRVQIADSRPWNSFELDMVAGPPRAESCHGWGNNGIDRDDQLRVVNGMLASTPSITGRWVIHRGFVSVLHCYLNDWLTHCGAIMSCHPVERVVTEKEPRTHPYLQEWFWEPGYSYDAPHQIPFLIGDLGGWPVSFIYGGLMVFSFPNQQSALDALNAVLIDMGRQKARERLEKQHESVPTG